MKLKPRRAEEPEINLVSLIDVVLMIVVFFMLSSTFVDESRLALKLPETAAGPTAPIGSEPMVITVSESGSYRVNELELVNSSSDTLRAAILRLAGTDREGIVVVRADARASHQSVVTAMDVLGRLGFRQINIATINAPSSAGTP